jgi:hypothetical protein
MSCHSKVARTSIAKAFARHGKLIQVVLDIAAIIALHLSCFIPPRARQVPINTSQKARTCRFGSLGKDSEPVRPSNLQ